MLLVEAQAPRETSAREEVPLGVGQREYLGGDPRIAFVLAVVVGVLVFALLMRIRKTFGMKE